MADTLIEGVQGPTHGKCRTCGFRYKLRVGRRVIRTHKLRRDDTFACPGSGQPPLEADRWAREAKP
jgi:hypothetical protein